MPIFLRSFLTTSFQFCRGKSGLLLKPSGSHLRASCGSLWWSTRERCPSHLRRLHPIMSSSFGSAVASQSLTFSFVTLSFQEIPRILRCHLWCADSSFFIWVTETGHSSALLSNVERTSASYSLVFTAKLIFLLFYNLSSFGKTPAALPIRTLSSWSQFPVVDM